LLAFADDVRSSTAESADRSAHADADAGTSSAAEAADTDRAARTAGERDE
jgi:hypothetical protein